MSMERSATFHWIAGVAAVASVAAILYNRYQAAPVTNGGLRLPPGPPARWAWEVALPTSNIGKTLTKLVAEYGPVISLREGRRVIVVVGTVEAAAEIMEKEGGVLVDRPRMVAAAELVSGGMRLILTSGGDEFRRLRKAAHIHLQPKAAEAYQDMQTESARDVILDILDDPNHHIRHARRFAAAVVLRLMYGKSTPTSHDDPEVLRIHQVSKTIQSVMRPGAFLVDQLPILKYVPGYGRDLKKYHENELEFFRGQLNRVEDEMLTGKASVSFVRTLLENREQHQMSIDEMSYLAGGPFSAGSDTTAGGISTLIVASARHPEAQARVREEIDRVVGRDRVPNFGDWNDLPQLQAYIAEGLRWRPVVPVGIPHRATKDIVWRGLLIPAGSTVIGCQWSIARDPDAFPDPERFDPQRWIDREGKFRTDLRSYPYGFGRRVCPGQHIASRSLFINLALLLWSFQIKERSGSPIDVDDFRESVTLHWNHFDVDFVPRMDETKLREVMESMI